MFTFRPIKYCKKEHNPLFGCDTLQLGTIAYYRNLDIDFYKIADPNEGKEHVSIKEFDPEKAIEDTKQLVNIPGKLKNCTIEYVCPNCYIFCLSLDPGKSRMEIAKRFDKNYESYYLIRDIRSFLNDLSTLIVNQFRLDWFDNEGLKIINQLNFNEIKLVNILTFHNNVRYVDSKFHLINGQHVETAFPKMEPIFRQLFCKDMKYQNDNEYRLVFLFIHPKFGVIPVKKEPQLLKLNFIKSGLYQKE